MNEKIEIGYEPLRALIQEKENAITEAQRVYDKYVNRAFERACALVDAYRGGGDIDKLLLRYVDFDHEEDSKPLISVKTKSFDDWGIEGFEHVLTWEEYSMSDDEFKQHCAPIREKREKEEREDFQYTR